MDWEEKLLTELVEKYRKSKKDTGDNKINRRTSVKPEKLYKKYRDNTGDYSVISAINDTVHTLRQMGFITFDTEKFGSQILRVYLNDSAVEAAEKYLHDRYGYVSVGTQKEEVLGIINRFEDKSPICREECSAMKKILNQHKIPSGYEKKSNILLMVDFLENNQEELYEREASVKVYGDSKYFAENTKEAVCELLRAYNNKPCGDDEHKDEILSDYHVHKEPQRISLKGNYTIYIGGNVLNFCAFTSGIEFGTEELADIDRIEIGCGKFMTIENRTAYLRYADDDTVTMYLGGYADRFQRDFIKKVYADNPNIIYTHFGDIDAGGFIIHKNLCEITGVQFGLFCMSKEELQRDSFTKYYHNNLTENDKTRLLTLRENALYTDTIDYMLEYNIKMEQEIVSLSLMQNKR